MRGKVKINVLQLVEGFSGGGAEKKLLELAKGVDPMRFRTVVCSLGLGDELQGEFAKLRQFGIEVIRIPRKLKIDPVLMYRLVRLIKEHKIDIIMTTLFYADVLGSLVGRIAGVKAVFSWETISAPEWLLWRRLWSYRLAIRFCDQVVSVSKATAKFLTEKRGVAQEKITVIPYGVDLRPFSGGDGIENREKMGLTKKHKVIGMVGRLHPQKGHVYLIDAAEKIVRKHPNVKFVIVGDGELRSDLEKRVEEKQLSNYFLFTGFRSDVPEMMKTFDIFTLPSLYEGLPNVILEAMAAAKPVVATYVDGSKEIVVDGETGILIPPRDVESLKNALCEFLESPEKIRTFGQNGRKRIENHYSLKRQVKSFEGLYEAYYQRACHKMVS